MIKLKDIIKLGGATIFNGHIVEFEEGYQVAYNKNNGGNEKRYNLDIVLSVSDKEFNNIIKDISTNKMVGLWVDTIKNKLYIDHKTEHIYDLEVAKIIARANNQLAIFDWSTKESIYLK